MAAGRGQARHGINARATQQMIDCGTLPAELDPVRIGKFWYVRALDDTGLLTVAYARVSSHDQRGDPDRQKLCLLEHTHERGVLTPYAGHTLGIFRGPGDAPRRHGARPVYAEVNETRTAPEHASPAPARTRLRASASHNRTPAQRQTNDANAQPDAARAKEQRNGG